MMVVMMMVMMMMMMMMMWDSLSSDVGLTYWGQTRME